MVFSLTLPITSGGLIMSCEGESFVSCPGLIVSDLCYNSLSSLKGLYNEQFSSELPILPKLEILRSQRPPGVRDPQVPPPSSHI